MENRTGTVQPDFLWGIYGGITMAQYHQIQQVPGVQVAAPIAMVGYTQLEALSVPVPAGTEVTALRGAAQAAFRRTRRLRLPAASTCCPALTALAQRRHRARSLPVSPAGDNDATARRHLLAARRAR